MRWSAIPSPEVWILWSHIQDHLIYIATYCPPSYLTRKLWLRVGWRWGVRGSTMNAKGDCECTSVDPYLGCLICNGLFRMIAFLSLFSKVSLYFNPEVNYLWVRNSSQVLIEMKTNLSPPHDEGPLCWFYSFSLIWGFDVSFHCE